MPARRTTKKPPADLGHTPTVDLGPYRKLVEGDEASVQLPERNTRRRLKFRWVDRHGNLTFTDGRGAHRTVRPEAVGTIHRRSTPKLRRTS